MEGEKPPAHAHARPRQQQQHFRQQSGGSSRGLTEESRRRTPTRPQRPFARRWTTYSGNSEDDAVDAATPTFRVVSFNVLADYLVIKDRETELGKRDPKYEWEHRRSRLLAEIVFWSPHVVCLQEVDHFEDFFEPELKKAGFVGAYKRRTGEATHDGCAIFVKKSKFRIVSAHPIEYHVAGHPVLNRDNIALVAVLEMKAGNGSASPARFLVANTHVLFNPGRGEVKLAQLDMLLSSLATLRQEYNALPTLLCGDFNLMPHSALYHFLSSGDLVASGLSRYDLSGQSLNNYALKQAMFRNENDRSRHHGNGTAFGKFDSVEARRTDFRTFDGSASFGHDLDFCSAYAQSPDEKCTGEPKFTTFHNGAKATVDYIWFTQSSFRCHGVAEMVHAGLLFRHKELPTVDHSSDHLPLVADFSLRVANAL